MLYIDNTSLEPSYNLALEEYVLKNLSGDRSYILLWQNKPSVIVGRFQNTLEEINADYINTYNIPVIRRLSGGGAVYHDLGNLNFTFIEKAEEGKIDFGKYAQRIVRALGKIGVNAEVSGRNDITIDGKKFSGNAQYYYRGKVLHHGTLLFNSDLTCVQKALKVSKDKIESKGIKSVKSRVTNICEYLDKQISLADFKQALLESLFEEHPFLEYRLKQEEKDLIERLAKDKYQSWDWNFGNSPPFNVQVKGRFPIGGIEVRLHVEKGLTRSCRIFGDFFSNRDISELERRLTGIRYDKENINTLLKEEELREYFGELKKEEFIGLLFA